MRLRNLINNWTSIWEKSTSAQGIVPAKSLGWDGTWDNQENSMEANGKDQSRLGTAIMGAQVGGKALPGTGKGARFSQRRDSGNLPLITRSALTILWRLIAFDYGWYQHPALHLVSLCGPPTCTGHPAWGGGLVENSQPWCLSGPSQGRGGVLIMNTCLHTEMDIFIIEMRTVLALIRRHFIISGWRAKIQDLPEDLSKGLGERNCT